MLSSDGLLHVAECFLGLCDRTRPHGLRKGGCTEISRLPTGGAAIGHRHRQHPAETAAETAGALSKPQER